MIDRSGLRARQGGFTLIEVLIAFIILALVLGVVYESFALSGRSVARDERQVQALLLAQAALTRTGVEQPLAAGEEIVTPVPGYEVHVVVRPFAAVSGGDDGALYEIEVTSRWQEQTRWRQLKLHTLKLGFAQ